MFAMIGYFLGKDLLEKVKLDMLCNIFYLWCVQIPIAYYLGIHLNLKRLGFFIAFLVYDIKYFISTRFVIIKYNKQLKVKNLVY